jgi:hypothetical protein
LALPQRTFCSAFRNEANKSGQRLRVANKQEDASVIEAELLGSNTCRARGITTRGNAPVLALCRALLGAGYDPSRPLHAYRGKVLALKVRSIGEGARLTVADTRIRRLLPQEWAKLEKSAAQGRVLAAGPSLASAEPEDATEEAAAHQHEDN